MKRPSSVSFGFWVVTNLLWLVLLAVVVLWKAPKEPASEGAATTQNGIYDPAGAPSILSGGPVAAGERGNGTGAPGGPASSAGRIPLGQGFESALRIEDPVGRMAAFSALLGNLTQENLPGALAAIESAPRQPGDDALLINFMRSWVRLDPTAAMDYALDNQGKRKFYVRNSDDQLIREWATRDPAAAMAYLDEVPRDHKMNRHSLHAHFVKGMAERDLNGAAAYAERNQYGRERGESIEFLADTYMAKGGEFALRSWLDGIDENGENRRRSFKEYAIVQAAEALVKKDPETAKAWVEEYLDSGLVDGRALTAAAHGMVKDDPEGAVDWLMDVSQGKDRSYAVASTIGRWADEDPNAAAQWLHRQELSPEMDPALSAFAREITREDPESALAWSNIITNDKRRAEAMIHVGRDWLRRDKQGFMRWLGENDLPEGVGEYFARFFN